MKSVKKTTSTPSATSMESLSLPRELYWDGKTEPISPLTNELFSLASETLDDAGEQWLLNDNFTKDITINSDDDSLDIKYDLDFPHELFNGEDLVVEICNLKDEHWNELKLPSPASQLVDYPIGTIISQPNQITKVLSIASEVDAIGGVVNNYYDTTILTQLTPPQSPPRNNAASPVLQTISCTNQQNNIPTVVNVDNFQVVLQHPAAALNISPSAAAAVLQQNLNYNNVYNNLNVTTSNSNNNGSNNQQQQEQDMLAREMDIVDEIVNDRIKELREWSDECESQSSCYTSPASHADDNSSIIDDEWMPSGASSYASSNFSSSAASSPLHMVEEDVQVFPNSSDASSSTKSSKKRTRPYGRGVEDRKIRKKEQNKNAATRYRQKKKVEMETVLSEEMQLKKRNEDLKSTLSELKHEAKYLKHLIREFHRKKK